MAMTQEKMDEKTRRRKSELQRSSFSRVVETHIDPDTGAGVLITEGTLSIRKGQPPLVKAHYYRGPQLKRPFKEETITSHHERIFVVERLKELLNDAKAAKVAPHDLKPGEVIASIWGYTMQDVRFYMVVDVPDPRKVRVVTLDFRITSGDLQAGTKVPVIPETIPDGADGTIFEVSMETGRPHLKTGSAIGRATRWSGDPIQVYSD